MSFKSFLFSKTFLVQLLIAFGIVALLLTGTMFAMRVYTNHGESFQLPDLEKMSVKEAERLLTDNKLNCKVTDSIYLESAVPGSVIGQMPVAGHFVKEGRTIFLSICALAPEEVAMPKLTDISFRQAVNIMQAAGLNVGHVDYVPSEFPNLVLRQEINGAEILPGRIVNKGSHVDLIIGKAPTGEKTVVPNLIGVSLSQARNKTASLFLNLGAIIYDESVVSKEDSLVARICRQRPTQDSFDEIDLGASIDIWLTVNEEKLNEGSVEEMMNDSIGGF